MSHTAPAKSTDNEKHMRGMSVEYQLTKYLLISICAVPSGMEEVWGRETWIALISCISPHIINYDARLITMKRFFCLQLNKIRYCSVLLLRLQIFSPISNKRILPTV